MLTENLCCSKADRVTVQRGVLSHSLREATPRWQEHAGRDLLAFMLLRWTGLRGSDAVNLRWSDIRWSGYGG